MGPLMPLAAAPLHPWRQLRQHAGWTQEDAARLLGVTLRTYRRWETGTNVRPPPASAWELLAIKAGVPIDWQPPPDETVTAETVKALRLRAGWTIEEAARLARTDPRQWQRWEVGAAPINEASWALVAIAAGVPENWRPA